jgi:hypothetical protein
VSGKKEKGLVRILRSQTRHGIIHGSGRKIKKGSGRIKKGEGDVRWGGTLLLTRVVVDRSVSGSRRPPAPVAVVAAFESCSRCERNVV